MTAVDRRHCASAGSRQRAKMCVSSAPRTHSRSPATCLAADEARVGPTRIGSPGRRLITQRPDRASLGSARHSPYARRCSGRLHASVGNQGRRPSRYRVAYRRCARSEFNPHARQPPRGIEEKDGRAGLRIWRRPIAPPGWVRRLQRIGDGSVPRCAPVKRWRPCSECEAVACPRLDTLGVLWCGSIALLRLRGSQGNRRHQKECGRQSVHSRSYTSRAIRVP